MRTASTFVLLAGSCFFCPSRVVAQDPACPEDDRTGRLTGVVYDEGRTLGLPGVTVNARWADGSAVVETGPDGTFEICGLPAGETVTAIANFAGLSSAPFEFSVAAGADVTQDLLVGMVAADAPRMEAGRVTGSVIDAVTREPIEAAAIGVVGHGFESLTNADGRFVLNGVPEGPQVVQLRHLAYGTQHADVQVRAGASTSILVEVRQQPIEVEPLTVTIEAVRDLGLEIRGFYERQEWHEKLGLGHFFTFEDIERRKPRLISHMIADVPGTRLDCSSGPGLFSCELSFVGIPRTAGCQRADVYIDGLNVIKSDGLSAGAHKIDELVNPAEIAGVEVYPGPASTPAEFSGASGSCGVVAIWTR